MAVKGSQGHTRTVLTSMRHVPMMTAAAEKSDTHGQYAGTGEIIYLRDSDDEMPDSDDDLVRIIGEYEKLTSHAVMKDENGISKGFRFVNSEQPGDTARVAATLTNLAANDKRSRAVAQVRRVHVLVMLARNYKFEGVQEQAARALTNLDARGDSNNTNAAVSQEAGSFEAFAQPIKSTHEDVRHEAAGAVFAEVIDKLDKLPVNEEYGQTDFPVDCVDAKLFTVKSYNEDDVHKGDKNNVRPAMYTAMVYMDQLNKNRDGMIENVDQTRNAWLVEGITTYCSGLVAAFQATVQLLI